MNLRIKLTLVYYFMGKYNFHAKEVQARLLSQCIHWGNIRGGTCSIRKSYGDVPCSWPLFAAQSALSSLQIYHQSTALVPLIVNFLFSKIAFLALFLAKISPLKKQNDPSFFKKIHSLIQLFGNLCSTHPPKNSWVTPLPLG